MTPTGTSITVWFACKICRKSFQNIDNFLKHKQDKHFDEFQNLSCIVFEERTIVANNNSDLDYNLDNGSSLPSVTVIKQEKLLSSDSDDQHLELKPVINIAQATKVKVEPAAPTVCQIKKETGTFPQNPYVIIQRLTSKEILQYNKRQTQAVLPQHLTVPLKLEVGPFKCPLTNCGKALKTRQTLAVHLKNHTNRRPLKCTSTMGGKAFKARNYLMQHLESHTQGQLHKCLHIKCRKSFKTRGGLLLHLQTHTMKKKFKCQEPNCRESFTRKDYLRYHLKIHSDTRHSFHCPHCNKLLSNRKNLVSHLKTHTAEKRFKCPHLNCEKIYSARSTFREHLKTHTEEIQYQCEEPNCGKAYKLKDSLRTHLKIHSDSRPCFHCPYPSCGEVFRNQNSLKHHFESRHSQDSSASGEKLFEYKKCDRTDCLLNRYKRRLDKIPIKCPQLNCTKEFKHESALRQHLLSHSSVKLYKCSVPKCKKRFKTRSQLNVHVQSKGRTSNNPHFIFYRVGKN